VLLLVKVAALSALVGYLTFQACAGVATIPALAFLHLQEVIAFAVAFTAFYFTGAVLFALVDEGEAAATAMVYSGVTSYLLVAKAGIVSGAVPMAATAVVSSIVGITYVLPAFIAVLQGGLMEQVLKAWASFGSSLLRRREQGLPPLLSPCDEHCCGCRHRRGHQVGNRHGRSAGYRQLGRGCARRRLLLLDWQP
jgi:hypothetical protein